MGTFLFVLANAIIAWTFNNPVVYAIALVAIAAAMAFTVSDAFGLGWTEAVFAVVLRAAGIVGLAPERMSERDAAIWESADSIGDLGRIGANYLEGFVVSHPAFQPGTRPYDETQRLIPVLAAVNRAGLFTDQSQPATDPGREPRHAYVAGFVAAADVERLMNAVEDSGLSYQVKRAGIRSASLQNGTLREVALPSHAADSDAYTPHLSDQGRHALFSGWRFAIEDPEPGRDDRLWHLLRHYAEAAGITVHEQRGVANEPGD